MDKYQVRSCISGSGSITYDPDTGVIGGGGGGGVTPAALTKTDDTNVTLTLGGTPATALLQATSLTLGWSGQLAVARGGTGLSALGTANQLIRVNAGATALEYFTPSYLTGLTVGTTPIASGTVGRVLFEGAGNVLQESSLFNVDTTNGLIIGGATARGTRLTVVNSSDTSTVKNIVLRNAADSADRLIVYGDGNIKCITAANNFNASNELQVHTENLGGSVINVGMSIKASTVNGFMYVNRTLADVRLGMEVGGVATAVISYKYNSDFRAAVIRGITSTAGAVGTMFLNIGNSREWGLLVANTVNATLGNGGFGVYDVTSGGYAMTFNGSTLNVGIGSILATARLHIQAGTTAAGTAPLKFTSGSLLTAAEAGAVEFLTDKAYLTITTGAARKEVTLNDAALTSGVTPVATTNGRLTDGLTLASGTYTPTLTGVSNVSSTTAFTCQYMRVGSVVTVSGKISVTATTNNAQTVLGISLPIASNFAAEENCGGLAHTINNTAADQHGASIYADATNDRAKFEYYETHGSADVFTFTFTYRII
jgi:hypothetical protein